MVTSLAEELTRPLFLITFTAVVGLLSYFYYRFIHSPHQVFARVGVKGPRPRFLLGNALEYRRLGETKMYQKFYRTYGPVFGFYLGTRPVLVVTDPILLHTVLTGDCHTFTTTEQFLTSTLSAHGLPSIELQPKGEEPQNSRKTLGSILLLPKLLKLIVPVVLHNFDSLLSKALEKSTELSSVDIWNVYKPYCMGVFLDVLGLSDSRLSQQLTAAITSYFSIVNNKGISDIRPLSGAVPCLESACRDLSQQAKLEAEFDALVDLVAEAIHEARQQHQKSGIKRNYLQVLLDRSLTNDQIVSYCVLILLVGYHTVSSCLSYTTYQLALHPSEQGKLYSEISNSVERENLLFETVDSLEFLDAVVQESLRLHCLTPKLCRVCVKDCKMKKWTIQRNTRVEIPVNILHHLHNYWDDPHSFCPHRFSTGRQMNNMTKKCPGSSQRTFIPFGQGAHSCVGMRLAVMCIKLSLTEVIQRFRFSRAPKSQDSVDTQLPGSPVTPGRELHIKIMKRLKENKLTSFASVVETVVERKRSVTEVNSPLAPATCTS